jgi:NADH-quinone oxidoreductase subunit M
MYQGFPLLSFVTFLPLLGALLLLFGVRGLSDARTRLVSKGIAVTTSVLTFVASLFVWSAFDPAQQGFQLIEKFDWIPLLGISYHKGIDGISLWFVLLSALLSFVAVLSAFQTKERLRAMMVSLLVLETMMIGVFTSLDFFLFYLFFEGVLIPMFLIIGVWGGERRIYASTKFFLYTFLGSVLMLVGIFAMVLEMGTSDMTAMIGAPFSRDMALWLWGVFFASFAVKTPMWPLHTWLPHAHVEAPTAGSVILAGVLLKMGGYGFIRVSLQMLPEASAFFGPAMVVLSLIAVIYASLVALAQADMKKMIAYSSVAHMGYVTLGIFSGRAEGLEGAMMVMLSHGLVAAALFLCVGVLYERMHTRQIARFGGVVHVMPLYSLFMMVFVLASIGLPGTSGFVGEFLTMQGAWQRNPLTAGTAAIGVVLGAAYMLWLYRRVFFGEAVKPDVKALKDLSVREMAMMLPLIIAVIWIGIYPSTFRSAFGPRLIEIQRKVDEAGAKHDAQEKMSGAAISFDVSQRAPT